MAIAQQHDWHVKARHWAVIVPASIKRAEQAVRDWAEEQRGQRHMTVPTEWRGNFDDTYSTGHRPNGNYIWRG